MGAVSASLTGWVAQFSPADSLAHPFTWPYVRLLVDQPLVTIFGLIGLVVQWLSWRNGGELRRTTLFLTLWLVWAMLLLAAAGAFRLCAAAGGAAAGVGHGAADRAAEYALVG